MALAEVSQDQQLAQIIQTLHSELQGRVPLERITAEAGLAYADLERHSRVPAFIPILTLRRARAALTS